MKFEHLIWIVIFLIYVVSAVIKKKRATSKPGGQAVAKKLPEWREKLNKFLAQMQQQAAGKEDLLSDPGPLRDEISFEEFEQVIEKPPVPKTKPSMIKTKPAVKRAQAEAPGLPVSEKKIRPDYMAFGRQDLRKAVIWSEILAPPLALRDK